MKYSILFTIFMSAITCYGKSYTLDDCRKMAHDNYPLIAEYDLVKQVSDFSVANAKKAWLPQPSLSAQATYQTEVPGLPDTFLSLYQQMGIDYKGMSKDQYKLTANIRQTIYDGGMIRSNVAATKAKREVDLRQYDVEIRKIYSSVNDVYFGILLLQGQIENLKLTISTLNSNLDVVKTMYSAGTANEGDMDKIQVEILSARQRIAELESMQTGYLNVLSVLCDEKITNATDLVTPTYDNAMAKDINRPELQLMVAQKEYLNQLYRGVNASVMPTVSAFIQGNYGYPGVNFFDAMTSHKWKAYMTLGINVQWNIGEFYTKSNRKKSLLAQSYQIDAQHDTFLRNLDVAATQNRADIARRQSVMNDDDNIINLRSRIRQRTETQIKNGVSIISDLVKEINAESMARQDKKNHEIELLQSIYNLQNTLDK